MSFNMFSQLNSSMFSDTFSKLTSAMLFVGMFQYYLPPEMRETISFYLSRYTQKFLNIFSPSLTITFDEYTNDGFMKNKIFKAIKSYLSDKSSMEAKYLKADYVADGKSLLLSMDDGEEVDDCYQGVRVSWSFYTINTPNPFPGCYKPKDKRYYQVTFHARHRKFVIECYLPYVLEEGKAMKLKNKRRKLLTNAGSEDADWGDLWTDIEFKHPARFDMLAMEKSKKQMLIDDLEWFKSSKKYYAEIGKPWKRGYLLYGPPGTGKSTLVAAMANFLEYDIYDLELTSVPNNIELRRLLIETSSKSIILIEDIDCSLDLTGERKKTETIEEDEEKNKKEKDEEKEKEKKKKVTLSGLLNFIDGIWSACGEERIIIFTTNHIDKLDPALIRRGRMDVHVELSYCRFESFKVFAKNYLKLESHPLFETIGRLLEETNMTPADVAENLMPRSANFDKDACLEMLIRVLEKAKDEAKLKPEKEMMLKDSIEQKPGQTKSRTRRNKR